MRIEICGGIAAGKTTLSKLLTDIGIHAVNEQFEVNPFLKEFYAIPDLFSFETEISFLLQHYHSIKKSWGKYNAIVCDYSFILDQAYADMTLKAKNEQAVFWNIKDEIMRQLKKPDLLIYLKCAPDILHERIIARGRNIENGITVDFLFTLTNMLLKQLEQTKGNIIVIESDNINFAENIAHKKYVVNLIENKIFELVANSKKNFMHLDATFS